MTYAMVIAGLPTNVFDRISAISSSKFAPEGHLFKSPLDHGVYSVAYVDRLIEQAYQCASRRNPSEPFRTLLVYVDYNDSTTADLREAFYPFSIAIPITAIHIDPNSGKNAMNAKFNAYIKEIDLACRRARRISSAVSGVTDKPNLTPLLLPPINFQGPALDKLLRNLYDKLPSQQDPEAFIQNEIKRFRADNPLTKAPEDGQSCYSDGKLFFRSPGRHRHGYLRKQENHHPRCILNARSRIGGNYDHAFHYDCVPVKGSLNRFYPNCHGTDGSPKERHVNISPSDSII